MNEVDVAGIEEDLKLLDKAIVEGSTKRQGQTELERFVHGALSKKFEWGNNQEKVEEKGVDAVVGDEHSIVMEKKLRIGEEPVLPVWTRHSWDYA